MLHETSVSEQCTVGDTFTEHGVIEKIFVTKKILVTPSILMLQKWFLHQNGVKLNHKSKSDMCNVWTVAGWEQEDQKLEKRCS